MGTGGQMSYLQQDLVFLILGMLLSTVLVYQLVMRRRLGAGWPAVLLAVLLTLAGAAELVFQRTTDTALIMLADAVNVFCLLFSLTVFVHYSLAYAAAGLRVVRLWFYLPALLLSLLYFLTPWLVGGIVMIPYLGFRLDYAPGFWLLPLYGALAAVLVLALNFTTIFSLREAAAKDRALYLIFVFFLAAFFFSSSLLMPFLIGTVNFSSTLPLLLAIAVIFFSCLRSGYFLAE